MPDVKKSNMTDEQRSKCAKIIHAAAVSGAAIAGGMAQLPGMDAPVLMGIEITMTISLGAVFGVTIDESGAKSIVLATIGMIAGRGISQVLVGWIPGIGNLINAGTAAGVIEVLGWAVANDFTNGKNRVKAQAESQKPA